jgi:hypothetical protein
MNTAPSAGSQVDVKVLLLVAQLIARGEVGISGQAVHIHVMQAASGFGIDQALCQGLQFVAARLQHFARLPYEGQSGEALRVKSHEVGIVEHLGPARQGGQPGAGGVRAPVQHGIQYHGSRGKPVAAEHRHRSPA